MVSDGQLDRREANNGSLGGVEARGRAQHAIAQANEHHQAPTKSSRCSAEHARDREHATKMGDGKLRMIIYSGLQKQWGSARLVSAWLSILVCFYLHATAAVASLTTTNSYFRRRCPERCVCSLCKSLSFVLETLLVWSLIGQGSALRLSLLFPAVHRPGILLPATARVSALPGASTPLQHSHPAVRELSSQHRDLRPTPVTLFTSDHLLSRPFALSLAPQDDAPVHQHQTLLHHPFAL